VKEIKRAKKAGEPTEARADASSMIDAMASIAEKMGDARQELYRKGVGYLYEPGKINYVSRLTADLVYGIMQMYITEYEYENEYKEKKTVFKLALAGHKVVAMPEDVKIPEIRSMLRETRIAFMELLISEGGKGRSEIVQMMVNAAGELGMMDRFKGAMSGLQTGARNA